MEEKDNINDLEKMLRLKWKSKLYDDVDEILKKVSSHISVFKSLGIYGKKFLKITVKQFYKDYKKGLGEINKKIPVFIELPKLTKEGNGMYSKTSALNPSSEKEITVNDALPGRTPEFLDYTENNP